MIVSDQRVSEERAAAIAAAVRRLSETFDPGGSLDPEIDEWVAEHSRAIFALEQLLAAGTSRVANVPGGRIRLNFGMVEQVKPGQERPTDYVRADLLSALPATEGAKTTEHLWSWRFGPATEGAASKQCLGNVHVGEPDAKTCQCGALGFPLSAALPPVRAQEPTEPRECSCKGFCKGRDGLSSRYRCALDGKAGKVASPVPPVRETTPEPSQDVGTARQGEDRFGPICGKFVAGGSRVAPNLYCAVCGYREQSHQPTGDTAPKRGQACAVSGKTCLDPFCSDGDGCLKQRLEEGCSARNRDRWATETIPDAAGARTVFPPEESQDSTSESALREQVQALIEQWRSESTNIETGRDYGYGLRMVATTLRVCADQLAALLAAPKEQ